MVQLLYVYLGMMQLLYVYLGMVQLLYITLTLCNYYIFTLTWFIYYTFTLKWCNYHIFTLTWCNYLYTFTLTCFNYLYLPWHGATIYIYIDMVQLLYIFLDMMQLLYIYLDKVQLLNIYLDMMQLLLQLLFIYLDMIQLLYIYIAMMQQLYILTWFNVIYSPLHVGWWLMVWQNSPSLQDSQVGSIHWESSQALLRWQSAFVSQSKMYITWQKTAISNASRLRFPAKENFREKYEILRIFFSYLANFFLRNFAYSRDNEFCKKEAKRMQYLDILLILFSRNR